MENNVTYQTIISAAQLYQSLEWENWVVIDCRHDLAKPDWGQQEYEKGHIPGAVFAHLDRDVSAQVTPSTGRHPLPEIDIISKRLGGWGIDNHTQVVVYDSSGGAIASRLWWQLHFLGHSQTAVLDGGYTQWIKNGYPVSSQIALPLPRTFLPNPQLEMLVDAAFVEKNLIGHEYTLVDARAPERFRGEKEAIDPVAGHIPGALNRFHGQNLGEDGKFLPPEILREQFNTLLKNTHPEKAVVYCGSGVTSCHHILALEIAGMPGSKLYAGSWSEWIRDPARPKAVS